MKLVNAEIGINGLGRDLVNEGFGDMQVKIGGEEVMCVKSILVHGNKTFKKLIEDDKFNGVLELYDGCDIESFLEIEKYYSGGTMELNEANICKILIFCLCYDDSFLLNKCKNYLKNHLNDSVMIKLIDTLYKIDSNNFCNIKEVSEDYIQRNGSKYLENEELLFKLTIEYLNYILSCKNLIIKNENWLLNQLIKWNKEMKKNCKNEKEESELKEEFKQLLKKYINFEKINKEEISNKAMTEIKELSLYDEIDRVEYISIDLKDILDDKIKDIIYRYYIKEDLTKIEIVDVEILKKSNFQEIISLLLNKDDIKLNAIGLLMTIDCNIHHNNFYVENKSEMLFKLLYEYKSKPNNRIIKCLCLFVDDRDNVITIKTLCGKEIIFRIFNFRYLLNKCTLETLIDYIKKNGLREDEKRSISEIVEDDDIIDRILINKISSFSYPQSHYSFIINENIEIIPFFNGTRCEFSINPSLPNELLFGKETGIICGKVKNTTERKSFEITCKNKINEKKTKITLAFTEVKFTSLNCGTRISILNNGKLIKNRGIIHLFTFASQLSRCYLDIKIESGIYHIRYKYIKSNNQYSNSENLSIGLSNDNEYSSNECTYSAWSGRIPKFVSHIGTVVNSNPNFNINGNQSVYEVIVDMNRREFSICHNNSPPILLVRSLPSPLYPFIELCYDGTSVELLSVSHQN